MVKIRESMINNIIKLGGSTSQKNQLEAAQIMCRNVFPKGKCVDPTTIPKLLPTIVKLMESEFPKVQEESIFFITVITTTSNRAATAKQNTQHAVDTGALSKLSKCLSSPSADVQELALRCIGNIAFEFPHEILATNGITANNINLCGSSNPVLCEGALNVLNTLIYSEPNICQNILRHGALKMIKKAFTHGPSIKLLGIKFLKIVASFEVRRLTDMIINEKFFPLILKQIRDGSTDVMKAKSAKVIKIIVSQNHEIIPSLIEEEIISVICDSLQSESDKLVINALSILQNIIDSIGYEEIREKFENSNGPQLLQNLHVHENEDIQELSNQINLLVVNDVKEAATVVGRRVIKRDARGSDEMEEVEPQQVAETSRSQRQAKRAAAPAIVRSNTRNKRAKVSRVQTNTEPDGSVNDNENNELYNDFDAPSRPPSPIRQPIVLEFANELPPDATGNDEEIVETPSTNAAENTDEILPTGTNDNANPTNFASFKYYSPSEFFISKSCEELGLQFHRKQYVGFLSKIDLDQITPNLKPAKYLQKKDKSGFSCFSLFFTGNEKYADLIEKKIKEYFVNKLDTLDKEKINKVVLSDAMLTEHVEVIVRMFKCRILIYCNGGWEKFGDWNSNDEMYIPVFVMEKKEIRGKIEYEIILSLKN